MANMKIGLVGCGNIGADLCIALQKGTLPAEIVALVDAREDHAQRIKRSFQLEADICDLEEAARRADFLVECATTTVVPEVLEAAERHGRGCLIMSVGGLMNVPDVFERVRKCVPLYIPSGALCGLDGIRAAIEAGLHSVTLTTRKPPKGLAGAPYLKEQGIELDALTEPMVVFEGNARDACRAFPANVNVAAALSLAGVGPEETKVRVIADPKATQNSHELVAEGAFGRLQAVTFNLPSPRNAKSSYLASLSAVAELRVAAQQFVLQASDRIASK